jgi:NADH dehydrogenase FAD-containing subunit
VGWVQDAVTAVDPEEDSVLLESGSRLTYEHLIVSAESSTTGTRCRGSPKR